MIAGITLISILFVGIFFYLSGGVGSQVTDGTVTITDIAGRTVDIPSQVNKVAGTGCSGREIIYLEAKDKMVGIEQVETNSTGGWGNMLSYMVANPELLDLPVIGDARKTVINYEKLSELNPDVVFAADTQQADSIQTKTGIPAVVVYTGPVGTSEQMDNYKDSLRLMGKVLDKEKRAEELIGYINSCEEDLNRRTRDNSAGQSSVYVGGQAYRGSQGLSSTNPFYPPLSMLNVENLASSLDISDTSKAIQIDKEQLLKWDPEVIIIEESSLESVKNDINRNPEYKNLKAVKEGRVYGVLAYCLYSYNKDVMLANAYYLGTVLYPDQFKDINPEQKADEIFEKFVGSPVYPGLKNTQGGFKTLNF